MTHDLYGLDASENIPELTLLARGVRGKTWRDVLKRTQFEFQTASIQGKTFAAILICPGDNEDIAVITRAMLLGAL